MPAPFTNSSNEHLYYLLAPTNWPAMEAQAVELGGHLATVRNSSENDWLLATFVPILGAANFFIGLTDNAHEGTFTWISGETNSFRNWKTGEPNNSNGNEDYAEVHYDTGKWNDVQGPSHYGIAEVLSHQTSNLPVLTIGLGSNDTVVVSWMSVTNQLYQLQATASLPGGWVGVGPYIYGNDGVMTVTNVIGGETRQFYRVAPVHWASGYSGGSVRIYSRRRQCDPWPTQKT
ncbi:MAG: C-type lectin domain-containing protein [Limisphaerales bacterium]